MRVLFGWGRFQRLINPEFLVRIAQGTTEGMIEPLAREHYP